MIVPTQIFGSVKENLDYTAVTTNGPVAVHSGIMTDIKFINKLKILFTCSLHEHY